MGEFNENEKFVETADEKFMKKYETFNEKVDEKFPDYLSDFPYWRTKVLLRPWIEVESQSTVKKYCEAWKSSSTANGIQAIDTYDTNDSWMSVTPWRITITESGLFHIVASADCKNPGTQETTVAIYVNGTQIAASTIVMYYSFGTDRRVMNCSKYANLVAWDYVELYWNSPSGGYVDVSRSLTYLQVVRQ